MTPTPAQRLFLTCLPVSSHPELPPDLLAPGSRLLRVHGGGTNERWEAWALQNGIRLASTHLRELDLERLQKHSPHGVLLELLAPTTTEIPDLETLADTLARALPSTQRWADGTGILGAVPFYTDAWGFHRVFSFVGETSGWWVAGTDGPAVALPADYPLELPQIWNRVQQRAQSFRSLLQRCGGKIFGRVSTHAFSVFVAPRSGLPAGALRHRLLSEIPGTGHPSGVYRLLHTSSDEDLLALLADHWA